MVGGRGCGSGGECWVCAAERGSWLAESGDSGWVRVGNHLVGVRCAGYSAEVQECAGDLSERVRGDFGEAAVGEIHHRGRRGAQRFYSVRAF